MIGAISAMADVTVIDVGTRLFAVISILSVLVGVITLFVWRRVVRGSEPGWDPVLEGQVLALASGLALFCVVFSIVDIALHIRPATKYFPSVELTEGGT
jgi:hypothetical protein